MLKLLHLGGVRGCPLLHTTWNVTDTAFFATGSFLLVVLFLGCLILKYRDLTEMQDIQIHMSIEQKEDYLLPISALTYVFFLAVLGTLLLSVLILFVQRAHDILLERREAITAKARRLKYMDSDKEVAAPQISDGMFHLVRHGAQRWQTALC